MTSLQMLRPSLDDLPSLAAALASTLSGSAGYGFRTYRAGDEAAWATIMNTGEMEQWDAARTREKLTGCPWPQFDPEGLSFFNVNTPEDLERARQILARV